MSKKLLLPALLVSLLALRCTQDNSDPQTGTAEESTGPFESFGAADVRFETNATDGDVEVVFEVRGADAGLLTLGIVSPDGRTVADFTAPDPSTLGIRQFVMESPEPPDVEGLKRAYPEGVYELTGTDAEGIDFQGTVMLDHELPATASFTDPGEEAEDVPFEGLEITWDPVPDIVTYIVEIEQDELGVNLTVRLPGSQTAFSVPDGFLQPGLEYALSIGTVTQIGNISYVETSFTTAGRE